MPNLRSVRTSSGSLHSSHVSWNAVSESTEPWNSSGPERFCVEFAIGTRAISYFRRQTPSGPLDTQSNPSFTLFTQRWLELQVCRSFGSVTVHSSMSTHLIPFPLVNVGQVPHLNPPFGVSEQYTPGQHGNGSCEYRGFGRHVARCSGSGY